MGSFDNEVFCGLLAKFWQVKDEHDPYDYHDWRVNPSDQKCPASRCAKILVGIEKQIRLLFKEIIKRLQLQRYKGKICFMAGASYFPNNPSIAILFEGESLGDGIFPVIAIYEQGIIIGCMESFARPQPDFTSIAMTNNDIGREEDEHLREELSKHLSRNYTFISRGAILNLQMRQSLFEAFEAAIHDYLECRGDTPRLWQGKQEGKWFTHIPVSSVEEWLRDVSELKDHWLFRGQGNAEWGLSTGIERVMESLYGVDKPDAWRIRDYENEAIQNFRREITRKPEYAHFCDIDLMATMQHYGSKTRLLDFSFSPLVALYMAVAQYMDENDGRGNPPAISVWAVKGDELSPARGVFRAAQGSEAKLKAICDKFAEGEKLEWWEKCILWHFDANNLLARDPRETVAMGVDIVLPNANNERISAQEGLFLMPRNMGESFENNLKVAFPSGTAVPNPHVVEYVFDGGEINSVKSCLHRFRITAKLIYPDLEGLAKSMSEKLDFGLK